MGKLKKKMKDVTGDGKFTFADVLKMRGVKPKKSMAYGGKNPMYKMPRLIVGGIPNSPRFDDYETVPTEFTPEMIRRLRDNARSKVAQGLKPSVADYRRMDIIDNPEKDLAMYDKPFATGLEEKPMMERKADILRERGLVDPMRYDIPEDMDPLKPRKPGEIMGYGGKVKMLKGGKVEYGLGGAIFKGLNEIAQGNGFGAAAAAAAKGLATPGSGIGGAAQLAGNLAQKSNNPMLQNIGKMAGMASNFLPGGNPMNAFGALQGLFQQRHGGYVSPKHRLR